MRLSLYELEFYSYFDYFPKNKNASNEASLKSHDLMLHLKHCRENTCVKAIELVLAHEYGKAFFNDKTVLVPVPRSHKLMKDSLWPSNYLCDELMKQTGYLNKEVILEREFNIQKSAYASKDNKERPKFLDHYNSIKCLKTSYAQLSFVLVDDLITQGSTVAACANLLKQSFPNSTIKAFAVQKSRSDLSKIDIQKNPTIGKVKVNQMTSKIVKTSRFP